MMRRALLLYVFWTCFPVHYWAQLDVADSLQLVLKNSRADSNQVNILNRLADMAWKKSDYEKAFSYVDRSKKLSEKTGYRRGLAKALHVMGLVYMYKGNYEKAQECNAKALAIRQELGDKAGISSSYNSIGNVYQYQGNYPASLKNHLEALRIREELGDKVTISQSYNNIGNVYYSQGNLEQALRYYQLALELKKETGSKAGMASSYNNIGLIFYEEKKYREAFESYMASVPIEEETGDLLNLAVSYNNIARVEMVWNKYDTALQYNRKALKLQRELDDQYGMARSYSAMAGNYKAMGKYAEAIECGKKGFELGNEIGAFDFIFEASNTLSEVYALKKDYSQALLYYKSYISARDSLLNEENTKKTVRLEMNYEFEKKEEVNRLEQEKKNALAAAEGRRQKLILFAISGIGLLILGFAIFAYRSFLQKKKANIEISHQKDLIEQKQKEILDSIHYARRIQTALLTPEKYIERNLKKMNRS